MVPIFLSAVARAFAIENFTPPITIGWFSRPLPQEYDNKMYLSELIKGECKRESDKTDTPESCRGASFSKKSRKVV
jgi:hypothetical protein